MPLDGGSKGGLLVVANFPAFERHEIDEAVRTELGVQLVTLLVASLLALALAGRVLRPLRSPLTVIQGHVELLRLDVTPQEQAETIDLVTDEIDRMNQLVQDLSLLARAEQPDFVHADPDRCRCGR